VKESPGTTVMMHCDHEVMGSSWKQPLAKMQGKTWLNPSPDPTQAGATCTGCPLEFWTILSKRFYDTSIGVATGAVRCGSFVGKVFSLLVVSSR
jgi:hypothetical protein